MGSSFVAEKSGLHYVYHRLMDSDILRVYCNRPAIHSFIPCLHPRLFGILHQIKNHIQTAPPNNSIILQSYRNVIVKFAQCVPAGGPLVPPPPPTLAELKDIILANWPTLAPLDHSRCNMPPFIWKWGLFNKDLGENVLHINPFLVLALETEPAVCRILLQILSYFKTILGIRKPCTTGGNYDSSLFPRDHPHCDVEMVPTLAKCYSNRMRKF
jgi:hypothetical protein